MIDYKNNSAFLVWPSVKPKYKNLYEFYNKLIFILLDHGIQVHLGFHLEYERKLIESTLPSQVTTYYDPGLFEIWARDFIGVRVNNTIVKPVYSPEYALRVKPRKFKFEESQGLPIQSVSDISLEFGNIVTNSHKEAIMCESVYKRNSNVSKLPYRLSEALDLSKICFLPHDPEDHVGHVDGMARFIDDSTIVLTDYRDIPLQFDSLYKIESGKQFYSLCVDRINNTLTQKNIHPFPFFINSDPPHDYVPSARGVYTNFLQFNNLIIVPQYTHEKDLQAINTLGLLTPKKVIGLDCNELAVFGGVLNCIAHTWCSSSNSN